MTNHAPIILTRHPILLLLVIMRFVLFIFVSILFGIIAYQYKNAISPSLIHYIILPTTFVIFNYAFLQVILNLIRFYNRIVIIEPTKITILHCSLFLMDDMEVMDMSSVLKIDVEQHGFISNLLWYGHLIFEQRNQIRKIHYLPKPYNIIGTLRQHLRFHNDVNT